MTRLSEIKARAKAATPGPWEWAEGTPSIIRKWNGLRCIIAQVKSMWLEWHENHGKASEEAGHNADFIANSRSDIDWLVERVEKLPTTADGVVCVGGEIVWLGGGPSRRDVHRCPSCLQRPRERNAGKQLGRLARLS